MTRTSVRRFLAALVWVALALLVTACTSGSGSGAQTGTPATPASGVPGSIAALTAGAQQLQLLSSESPLNPGTNRFGFDLLTAKGGVAQGGTPQVYVTRDPNGQATGPFAATWYAFTAYQKTGDTSPLTDLPGTYAAQVDLPEVGTWTVAVLVQNGSQRLAATGSLTVTDQQIPAALGSKATSVKTPVATSDAKIAEICTRKPVDKMHYISLDKALKNGKPTVVNFGTPLLCESRLCGPVIDEQILVFQKYGADAANFVHVEEFLPGPDLQPPPATADNASPAFKAWGFQSEPWVIVIDKGGVIRARFEGPVMASEIEAALQLLV